MQPKRLFIIDAMALAFRSFHAFGMRPLTTSQGLPTSAVFGCAMFMNKLITEQKPDYLVVATDSTGPTFRHEMYEKYKANRSQMPEDLAKQLPYFFELMTAYGCQTLKQQGVEADDLIGSIARRFASPDLHVYIVSGDKDFMQLVNAQTYLYVPRKGEDATVIDKDGVYGKFSCTPEQVIDCLALIGDTSDNVPGVPGIGEKGAAKLISAYGSLENIYANLADITNKKQRNALEEGRDKAFLSRQLVTIKADVPVHLNLNDIICTPSTAVANESLLKLYTALEFKNLVVRLETTLAKQQRQPQAHDGQEPATIDDTHYHLVQERQPFLKLVQQLSSVKEFAFDTETTGLDIVSDRPIGISLSFSAGEAYYVPLTPKHLKDLSPEEVLEHLSPIFLQTDVTKIGHNLKFDLQMLRNIGLEVKGPYGDPMICDYLLDASSRQHGLDLCCLKHLNYRKISISSLIGSRGEIPMMEADLSELSRYACEDADLTFRLWRHLIPKIKEAALGSVLEEIELPLIPILAQIEQTGVFIDDIDLAEFSNRLSAMLREIEARIYKEAGTEFNINSTKQLQDILFNRMKLNELLGLKRLKKTKSGFSTDESVLRQMATHPLPKAILEYRSIAKLKNTYVDTLPQLIQPKTHRVHTSFHQTGTATGRLSSSNPNLQNIPIRSELGQEIRKAFKAQDKDHVLISADYSQVELRLLAHIAKEEALAQAFQENQDIHRATAAKIFGVAPEAVDALMRSRAKAINFGIIYGMGPRRLSQETGVSMTEASQFISRYFSSYPRIEAFIDEAIASAKELGYSTTISGRRRPMEALKNQLGNQRDTANAENVAVNSPIQGSAADLIKLAMIHIDRRFREQSVKAKMLLQVHDELVFECPKDDVEKVVSIIRDSMEHAMKLSVPLQVDIGIGSNWLEAH